LLKFKNFIKFFRFFSKNNAGRNNIGGITVFSKGLKKKRSSISSVRPIIWDSNLNTVVSIFRNQKKLFTLNRHITGSFSVYPYIAGVCINQKIFSSNLPKSFWNNNLPGNLVLLKFLTKFTLFSNLYLNNIKTYALSNGTYCQILDHFYDYNLIKITLPSKQIKILSGWNFVILGKNSQVDYKYNRVGKAGVNYIFGKKPKVRGVARNPVDHPHGGRTKTNQPEVSIWGWIAKRNK
jgi:large subunit ribosomal protein L2